MKNLFYIPLILTCALTAFAADDPGRAALEQAEKAGGGVACVTRPECTDAALALAHNKSWAVHLLFADKKEADIVRQKAAKAGLLGHTVFVECAPLDRLPHADHLLDLLITSAATPEAEALRVISPIRGRAFVGDKVITKPALPGSDWWTHRVHLPDNNSASGDTAFQLPAMVQYVAAPTYQSFLGGSIMADDGLVINLFDWEGMPIQQSVAGKFMARSVYNGQLQWVRELPQKIKLAAPTSALVGNRFYIAADDGCVVQVVDAVTGADLPAITLAPDTNRNVIWLAVQSGKLYALLGDRDWPRVGGGGFYTINKSKAPRVGYRIGKDEPPPPVITGVIVCQDLKTGKPLWRHEEPAAIDFRVMGLRDGRVYFYSEQTRLACLDADGKLVWENRDKEWIDSLSDPKLRSSFHSGGYNVSTMVVGPEELVFSLLAYSANKQGLVFSTKDGKLLWKMNNYRSNITSITGDGILHLLGNAYHADTGKPVEGAHPIVVGGWCGYYTWIPGVQGMVGHCSFGFKGPCASPVVVAGGVMTFMPGCCDCDGLLHGAGGFMSGSNALAAASSDKHLLETGVAKAPTMVTGAGDWPQFRGDARHLGSSQLPLPVSPVLRPTDSIENPLPVPAGHWRTRMEWLDRPTPPVTAGGMAFYGLSDGRLRAIRIADGKEVWVYAVGTPILTAPVFAGGHLYAAGGDGWVYCLDAASGTLIWRWRAAPAERSMMIYGKLMSSWPVISVLADGDALYGQAGFNSHNGSVTFALDIQSGKPKWTHWNKPFESQNTGLLGYMALIGRSLRPGDYADFPGAVDCATGLTPKAESGSSTSIIALPGTGQDCIAVNEQLVLRGGVALLENQDKRHTVRYSGNYLSYPAEEYRDPEILKKIKGAWQHSGCWNPAIPRSIIAPAISDTEIALLGGLPGNGTSLMAGRLSLWKQEDWRQIQKKAEADPKHGAVPLDAKQALWCLPDVNVNAVVLCKDAVLAVVAVEKPLGQLGWGECPEMTGWKLSAFNRADGKEIWSTPLPGEPVYNGLAPAADGSWVLTLRDGNLAIVTAKNLTKESK